MTFEEQGGTFLMRKYSLYREEVERIFDLPEHVMGRLLRDVEAWRDQHALPSTSAMTRGYLLDRLKEEET